MQSFSGLKEYLKNGGLAMETESATEDVNVLPPMRKLVQMWKSDEVRRLVKDTYQKADLIAGGTFSGLPVVGIYTDANNLTEQEIQELHHNDFLQTKKLWNNMQDANYFSNWKDWALYYSNTVSALSGMFCLRYLIFSDSQKFQQYKKLVTTLKTREVMPMLGAYCFACDSNTGEVVKPAFTFWFGAGLFAPKKMGAYFKK